MSDPSARVFAGLIADIAAARIPPGERLPEDAELGERFGVDQASAAVAVGRLARHGLVELAVGGWAVVAPEAQWDVLDPGVLEVLLASPRGPAILAEYLEYRRLIEVVAAGLAAEHARADDLPALSDALDAMTATAEDRTPDAEARFHRADVAFHQALLAAGRNRPLELAAAPLQAALCTARHALARPEMRRERGLPEHRRILAAVAQGDPEAAREAMEGHLDTVESYLREYADLARSR
jgi:GntR family transcriptional regulator, transcriptional repressor for pyruvate dehydrogenase complex